MSLECKVDFSPATEEVKKILHDAKTVAVVGISSREDAPSHDVAKYLMEKGFKVICVNPKYNEVLGVKCYPDLRSIPEPVDVVDIFRRLDAIPGVVDEAIQIRAGAVWMQQGLEHEESAQKARRAGLGVVMNKCVKIEHSRLYGC